MYIIIAVIIAIALEGMTAFIDISNLTRGSISPITKWFILLFILFHNISSSLVCWILVIDNINPIALIFIVGLGLPILLKSKIFVIKFNDMEIPVGLEPIYQRLLDLMQVQILKADMLAKLKLYKQLETLSFEKIDYFIKQLVESTEVFQNREELQKLKEMYDATMKMELEKDRKMALVSVLAKYGNKRYIDKILMSAKGDS